MAEGVCRQFSTGFRGTSTGTPPDSPSHHWRPTLYQVLHCRISTDGLRCLARPCKPFESVSILKGRSADLSALIHFDQFTSGRIFVSFFNAPGDMVRFFAALSTI